MASRSSVSCDAVLEGPVEVVRQLVGVPTGDQGGDGDEAAVPGGEFRPVPDVLEEHVVGQLGKLRGDIADGAAAAADLSGLIDHRVFLPSGSGEAQCGLVLYSSSVTCCPQSVVALGSSLFSNMARCSMKSSGVAPCQCSSPGGV